MTDRASTVPPCNACKPGEELPFAMTMAFQPDIIKLDMALVRGFDADPVRQAIVRGILGVCAALHIDIIAEGVQAHEELALLDGMGIRQFQGDLFARPGFESLPEVAWPELM